MAILDELKSTLTDRLRPNVLVIEPETQRHLLYADFRMGLDFFVDYSMGIHLARLFGFHAKDAREKGQTQRK